jgi:hypothetical protein
MMGDMAAAGPRLTALELLERLVGFDTESQKSNLALIDFVEDYLRGWGVPVLRAPSREGDKAARSPRSGRPSAAASSCRATPTSCPSPARRGRRTPSRSASPRAAPTGAAPST